MAVSAPATKAVLFSNTDCIVDIPGVDERAAPDICYYSRGSVSERGRDVKRERRYRREISLLLVRWIY
jgi:hypothetical protein